MTAETLSTMRELHTRRSATLRIRLLWHEREGSLAVDVADQGTGAWFAVRIREGDEPMRVFEHPFAYAAWRGADAGTMADFAENAGAVPA